MSAAIALAAAAAIAAALAAFPTQAGQTDRAGYRSGASQGAEVSAQNRKARTAKRARPRITVRRRSYLDAGTEVYPGSKNYTDYVFPPGYTAYSNFDPTGAARWPLPGPFELPSYHAPGFGY